jgi:prepilin-type N-terminal cleavage/methylation domain-containing protein
MTVRFTKKSNRSKSGFTLLETLISVALLLIVSMFIYQGFMSTIQYSSSTAGYEKSGQAARRDIHANIGARDVSATPKGLYVDSPFDDKVITISGYRHAYDASIADGVDDYEEAALSPASIRFGFSFQQRACPDPSCSGVLQWYRHTDDSIQQKCDTCTYDSVLPSP